MMYMCIIDFLCTHLVPINASTANAHAHNTLARFVPAKCTAMMMIATRPRRVHINNIDTNWLCKYRRWGIWRSRPPLPLETIRASCVCVFYLLACQQSCVHRQHLCRAFCCFSSCCWVINVPFLMFCFLLLLFCFCWAVFCSQSALFRESWKQATKTVTWQQYPCFIHVIVVDYILELSNRITS